MSYEAIKDTKRTRVFLCINTQYITKQIKLIGTRADRTGEAVFISVEKFLILSSSGYRTKPPLLLTQIRTPLLIPDFFSGESALQLGQKVTNT